MGLKALSVFLRTEREDIVRREQREEYIADLLWFLAAKKQISDSSLKMREIFTRSAARKDTRTGKEIIGDLISKMENQQKG